MLEERCAVQQHDPVEVLLPQRQQLQMAQSCYAAVEGTQRNSGLGVCSQALLEQTWHP